MVLGKRAHGRRQARNVYPKF